MAKLLKEKTENGFKFVKGKTQLIITDSEIRNKGVTGFLCFKREFEEVISISDVLFFDYAARFFGLLGYTIKGGAWSQFFMKGLKKNDCLEIRKWLIDHGTRLSAPNSTEGKTYKNFGLHLFKKETITILDDGLAHNRKTLFTNRDTIVPYDKVDFFLVKNSFLWITKKLFVIGQLSFSTHNGFSAGKIKEIKKLLKEKSVKIADGKLYHPNFFSGVKKRKKTSLIILDDQIVYMDSADSKNKGEEAKLIRSVTSFSCKPIFSLFNRVAVIKGTGSVDMRTGTATEQTISFPGVFFFWWFCCGKIKMACKRLYNK